MIFITQCDSPALWQTYLSDPASITMEGILILTTIGLVLYSSDPKSVIDLHHKLDENIRRREND